MCRCLTHPPPPVGSNSVNVFSIQNENECLLLQPQWYLTDLSLWGQPVSRSSRFWTSQLFLPKGTCFPGINDLGKIDRKVQELVWNQRFFNLLFGQNDSDAFFVCVFKKQKNQMADFYWIHFDFEIGWNEVIILWHKNEP